MASTNDRRTPDPQVEPRSSTRRCPAAYKARILAEYDGLEQGRQGCAAAPRGLYSSLITGWREQRDRGAEQAAGRAAGPAEGRSARKADRSAGGRERQAPPGAGQGRPHRHRGAGESSPRCWTNSPPTARGHHRRESMPVSGPAPAGNGRERVDRPAGGAGGVGADGRPRRRVPRAVGVNRPTWYADDRRSPAPPKPGREPKPHPKALSGAEQDEVAPGRAAQRAVRRHRSGGGLRDPAGRGRLPVLRLDDVQAAARARRSARTPPPGRPPRPQEAGVDGRRRQHRLVVGRHETAGTRTAGLRLPLHDDRHIQPLHRGLDGRHPRERGARPAVHPRCPGETGRPRGAVDDPLGSRRDPDRQVRGRTDGRPGRHKIALPAQDVKRQPLQRGPVQDSQVPARLSGSLLRPGSRPRLVPRVSSTGTTTSTGGTPEWGWHTPYDVHHGLAERVREYRAEILADAHSRHPSGSSTSTPTPSRARAGLDETNPPTRKHSRQQTQHRVRSHSLSRLL